MPSHIESSCTHAKERPELSQMTVSVNRHPDMNNSRWNCQIPLHWGSSGDAQEFEEQLSWQDLDLSPLLSRMQNRLGIKDLKVTCESDLQIVWCMHGSNNLGHVIDADSFKAAVMVHWYNYERVVQLYIVNKNSELPRLTVLV